jgi:hypothetical protein
LFLGVCGFFEVCLMGWRSDLLVCSVVLLVFVLGVHVCAAVNADEARVAIESAEARVVVCYKATADAENAGGNVTELAAVLNSAGDLLSQAKVAYDSGKFDVAFGLASNCTALLDGFTDRATALRDSAADGGRVDFLVNVVGSTFGAVAVVVVGWVLWIYLKKRYAKVGGVV